MNHRGKKLWRRCRQAAKIAVVVVVAGVGTYWLMFSPLEVQQYDTTSSEIVSEVMGTGTLDARYKATISPKINGRISEVLVDQGDTVKADQLLAKLDDADLRQQVEIAQADLAATTAALERWKADEARAKAVFEQAKKEHERTKKMQEKKIVSEAEVDKSNEALEVARAGIAGAKAAFVEARKRVIVSEKNLAYHRALLSDTKITAPFDGLIVRRDVNPGDTVVVGSTILVLISTKELWITACVDETDMARVRVGQPARIIFRSESDHPYQGVVARLGRETDRETREFNVDVRAAALPKNWTIGQRADVFMEAARKKCDYVLPSRCILWHDGVSGVYVNDGGRAAWRPLTLGLRSVDAVEVVKGLEPGEAVVLPLDPNVELTDGRRITVP